MHISEIPTPALLLDRTRLDANIDRMARRAEKLGVALRPHVKTHKSAEIGRLQAQHGASGITVSTLYEARRFAAAGFDDITWAFPLIVDRMREVLELADQIRLSILIDGPVALARLVDSGEPLRVFLKIDCGYHRVGVDPDSDLALDLARRLSDDPKLEFAGLLTHAGHSYDRQGRQALLQVAHQERDVMTACADRLRRAGVDVPLVSVGSTPTMSVIDDLDGVDEIRPGNYVFYDHSQVAFGACEVADCALSVLTSVVSSQPDSGHSIVDAGALAMSKDVGPTAFGHDSMGAVLANDASSIPRPELCLTTLSQEHGHLSRSVAVGTRLRLLPNHSCLTAAQFDEYTVVEGEYVVDRWPIMRGRSSYSR